LPFLNAQLTKLQTQINDHIDRYPGLKKDLDLLQSIPAIGPQSGMQLLAVMHTHQFNTAEQLSAYLGLVPIERQSGSSLLGRAKLSKAGPAYAQCSTWPLSSPPSTTPTSKLCLSVYLHE
jgi:transposase